VSSFLAHLQGPPEFIDGATLDPKLQYLAEQMRPMGVQQHRPRYSALGLFFAGRNLGDEHYRKDANGYSFGGVDVVSLGDRRGLSAGVEFQFR
jgi:hypothetical protein